MVLKGILGKHKKNFYIPYKALDNANANASDRLPYIERVRSVAAEENKRVRAKLLPEHDPRPNSRVPISRLL